MSERERDIAIEVWNKVLDVSVERLLQRKLLCRSQVIRRNNISNK